MPKAKSLKLVSENKQPWSYDGRAFEHTTGYRIDLQEMQTPAQLAGWLLHLASKPWGEQAALAVTIRYVLLYKALDYDNLPARFDLRGSPHELEQFLANARQSMVQSEVQS